MPYLGGNIWGDPIISVHPKKIGWCQVCPATDAATFFPQMFYLSIIIYAWFGNGTKMPWAMHNARLNSRDFFALVLVNRSEACGNIRCIKSHQERDIYVSVVSMSYIENSKILIQIYTFEWIYRYKALQTFFLSARGNFVMVCWYEGTKNAILASIIHSSFWSRNLILSLFWEEIKLKNGSRLDTF